MDEIFGPYSYPRLQPIGDAIFIKVRGEYVDRTTLLKIIAGLEAAADIMLAATPEDYMLLYKSYSANNLVANGKLRYANSRRSLKNAKPCVYFLQGSMGVKIGRTTNLPERKHKLESFAKEYLTVLAYVETDEYKELESALHVKFAHLRTEGEWFNPVKEIIDWLEGLRGA